MTRIAVVDNQKLKDMQLKQHIRSLCPVNRTGVECIKIEPNGRLSIDENLCTGCGICPKAAPYAISIVNLPEELTTQPIHRYGKNGFALYSLPVPVLGKVVGIIGRNGMGKSTAVKLLSGQLQPNLGKESYTATHKDLIDYFKGSEAQAFFEKVRDGMMNVAYKPQQVDLIPAQFSGSVRQLLEKVDEKHQMLTIAEQLAITPVLDSSIRTISGGELQRVAIAATVLKKASIYFFDEPTAFLDVKQRLKVSAFIRNLANDETGVMVIEHDLIMLDYMTDQVHLMYGVEGTYGVVSGVKNTKNGINTYLDGYLKEENIRFRDHPIRFEKKQPFHVHKREQFLSWQASEHTLGRFTLHVTQGSLSRHLSIGVVGENGTGKTTFVKLLAEKHDISVAYKEQHIKAKDDLVMNYLADVDEQLIRQLSITPLLLRPCTELSGGELQRVEIARCLGSPADLYLLDEPSAYLDIEQRLVVSKIIKDQLFLTGKSALVVDHDLVFIDYLSDELMVFEGTPALKGRVTGPFSMEEGMNRFLKDLGISFRRDEHSHCPRTNKKDSQMDRKQKHEGKLYYT